MEGEKTKSYTEDFKFQILNECFETNNYSAVCRKYDLPTTTVCGWIRKYKNRDKNKRRKAIKGLEKKISDLELENQILKELIKKSHQLWLKG